MPAGQLWPRGNLGRPGGPGSKGGVGTAGPVAATKRAAVSGVFAAQVFGATPAAVAFNAEVYDNDTIWSTDERTRLYARTGRPYRVVASVDWNDPGAGGQRNAFLRHHKLDGSVATIAGDRRAATNPTSQVLDGVADMLVGEYVTLELDQTSGTNKGLTAIRCSMRGKQGNDEGAGGAVVLDRGGWSQLYQSAVDHIGRGAFQPGAHTIASRTAESRTWNVLVPDAGEDVALEFSPAAQEIYVGGVPAIVGPRIQPAERVVGRLLGAGLTLYFHGRELPTTEVGIFYETVDGHRLELGYTRATNKLALRHDGVDLFPPGGWNDGSTPTIAFSGHINDTAAGLLGLDSYSLALGFGPGAQQFSDSELTHTYDDVPLAFIGAIKRVFTQVPSWPLESHGLGGGGSWNNAVAYGEFRGYNLSPSVLADLAADYTEPGTMGIFGAFPIAQVAGAVNAVGYSALWRDYFDPSALAPAIAPKHVVVSVETPALTVVRRSYTDPNGEHVNLQPGFDVHQSGLYVPSARMVALPSSGAGAMRWGLAYLSSAHPGDVLSTFAVQEFTVPAAGATFDHEWEPVFLSEGEALAWVTAFDGAGPGAPGDQADYVAVGSALFELTPHVA